MNNPRFYIASNLWKKRLDAEEAKRRIILEYLTSKGGASSDEAAWDLRDTVKPLMCVVEMAQYLRILEYRGVVMFKDGKYQMKEILKE